jgi:hypothetical protein
VITAAGGFARYLRISTSTCAAARYALLVAYGVVATVRTTDRTVRFLGLSSLAMIAMYGVSTHGEGRYVLLPSACSRRDRA